MISSGSFIPFNRPCLGEEEAHAAREVILSGNVSGNGPLGLEVEKRLEALLRARRVLLVTSCTHAMELAFLALGVGPGDEVLLPSFTFVSTANAVLAVGAQPVFADIRINDLTIDPESARQRITPRTRAIIVVHYAGISCQMDDILAVARDKGLAVVEDAAHALGSSWRGKPLGNVGDIGCVSFHGTKNIVCGEGGAFVTSSEGLARAAELIREKGTNRSAFLRGEVERYTWVSRGSSYVLSEILAAILLVQIGKMPEVIRERERIWTEYAGELAELDERGLLRIAKIPDCAVSNSHIFFIIAGTPAERSALIRHLRSRGIEATFHFIPLHTSPFALTNLGTSGMRLPVTEYVSERLVRLPLYPGLTREEQGRVIQGVLSFYRGSGVRWHAASSAMRDKDAE